VNASEPEHLVDELRENIAGVRARIAVAAARADRDAARVTLVGVTKTVPVEVVDAALRAGLSELGENRAQELVEKAVALGPRPAALRWHFVGRLQRNKVRSLAPHVAVWESIDRSDLVTEVARRAPGATVFVQVDVAGEPQKGGCPPPQVAPLVDTAHRLGLDVVGLMAVPPMGEDPRPHFARLRGLAEHAELRELSMGMSDDFEIAVEEGATTVRVGRALFGPRRASDGLRR